MALVGKETQERLVTVSFTVEMEDAEALMLLHAIMCRNDDLTVSSAFQDLWEHLASWLEMTQAMLSFNANWYASMFPDGVERLERAIRALRKAKRRKE